MIHTGQVHSIAIRSGTGPSSKMIQRQLAQMKAHMVARYRLAAVKGRPEELQQPGSNLGVSISYGCRQIRVRLMEGREWLAVTDFQPGRPWRQRLQQVLDAHFGGHETDKSEPVVLSGDYDRAVAA